MPDRAARAVRLPDWPAVLREDLAAAYLSLSPTTFRTEVAPQLRVIHLTTRRQGWLRADLDRWIAQRAGAEASSPEAAGWDSVWSSSA